MWCAVFAQDAELDAVYQQLLSLLAEQFEAPMWISIIKLLRSGHRY
jgi:hypothetical protein